MSYQTYCGCCLGIFNGKAPVLLEDIIIDAELECIYSVSFFPVVDLTLATAQSSLGHNSHRVPRRWFTLSQLQWLKLQGGDLHESPMKFNPEEREQTCSI